MSTPSHVQPLLVVMIRSGHDDVLGTAAVVVLVVVLGAWLLRLTGRGVADPETVRGPAFVAVAWAAAAVGDGDPDRSALLVALVSIWALRRTGHLLWRRRLEPPPRVRPAPSASDALRRLVTMIASQGAVVWVVSLPVQLAMTPVEPRGVGTLAVVGVVVWSAGFFVDTVADSQLARFRADPTHASQLPRRGVWRLTRRPRLLADLAVWWGIFAVAAETPDARWGLVGPLVAGLAALTTPADRARPVEPM